MPIPNRRNTPKTPIRRPVLKKIVPRAKGPRRFDDNDVNEVVDSTDYTEFSEPNVRKFGREAFG